MEHVKIVNAIVTLIGEKNRYEKERPASIPLQGSNRKNKTVKSRSKKVRGYKEEYQ
jgi:hypothetical protein